MTEIRRIVCPTDFSKFSRRALQNAIALARRYEAPIIALHVLPLPGTGELAAGPGPVVLEQTYRQDLSDFVEPARAEGVPIETRLLRGSTAEQILECVGTTGDLLVMGTHGRGGFQRWILGSVTETVLRRARSPVLTVCAHAECREDDTQGRFCRILCPVDFSTRSATAAGYAFAMAEDCGNGKVTFLHVLDSFPVEQIEVHSQAYVKDFARIMQREARAKLEGIIADSATGATKAEQLVATGKAHEEILRTAEEQETDLIVMGVHGRSALDLMLFGSTTHHVVRGATCPVLTIYA